MKQYYLWGISLALFFFLRGSQFLFNNFSPNWAYIVDQLGLAIIGSILALVWLRKKNYFTLGWKITVLIVLFTLVSHYHSFYRPFFFEELRNVISPISILHLHQGDPSSVALAFAGPEGMREKYSLSFTTLIYELVGIHRSYSLFFYAGSGILLLICASLGTAFLTGILSKSKLAAIIAALLVGVNTNAFMPLIWVTNIPMDALAIILVTLTVGVWFIARKTQDKKGIFISLILLAATLKGGGVVRTAMTGGLLILTDMFFFQNLAKKGAWLDWVKVIIISGVFYLLNPAMHWHPASTPSSTTMSFLTRLAFLADATTRSLVDPLMLIPLINHLKVIFPSAITWSVVLGTTIFLVGTILAFIAFFLRKYIYFTWGWTWFYIYIWFVPWLAELYNKPNDDVENLDFVGYKYAFLSLVGLYIAIGIFLSQRIKELWASKNQIRKILGFTFLVLTATIIFYRGYEFVKLDYNWRVDYSIRVGDWYNLVFGMFPPPTSLRESNKNPSALVELDKDHIGMEAELFIPLMYHDGSLLFYRDTNLFYKEAVIEKKIPPDRIYAVAWNENKKKIFNLTAEFRQFLKTQNHNSEDTPDFSDLIIK